jgi:hypothetical protein
MTSYPPAAEPAVPPPPPGWKPTPYGLSASERRQNLTCQQEHRDHWAVIARHCNYSAFNGYQYTPSDYSAVRCGAPGCGRVWRTNAAYADELPAAEEERKP